VKPTSLTLLLLVLLASADAAEPKAQRLPNPPDTDFSAFEWKSPWVLSDGFLQALTGRYAERREDLHADPRGSWLALVEASQVWALYSRARCCEDAMPLVNELRIDGPLAYHLRAGDHALTTFDWTLHLDHADALFRR
jgi:hypothetical protein